MKSRFRVGGGGCGGKKEGVAGPWRRVGSGGDAKGERHEEEKSLSERGVDARYGKERDQGLRRYPWLERSMVADRVKSPGT